MRLKKDYEIQNWQGQEARPTHVPLNMLFHGSSLVAFGCRSRPEIVSNHPFLPKSSINVFICFHILQAPCLSLRRGGNTTASVDSTL